MLSDAHKPEVQEFTGQCSLQYILVQSESTFYQKQKHAILSYVLCTLSELAFLLDEIYSYWVQLLV